MVDVQWWLSGYDNRVHAFGCAGAGREFGEALCEHSVPNDKITCTDVGERCLACLLIYGDMLADTHGDAVWRAS
ncbi:hypothetical protein [Actinophytocola xanthii]|uniref:Uncharacterized protein n=1 Tax=Actinophytocola xanthii TaxID=1912961 RepID=A0A1Q8CRY5_9PSEU|nr:hypothetical protein [Actinophytocola xanthii]OLF17110.1 hypothetical protein BU204_13585 [Actinophytocola xanthii]